MRNVAVLLSGEKQNWSFWGRTLARTFLQ